MTLSDTLREQVAGRRDHVQSFLGVYKLTEGNWFITTRTDSTRTNLSHEAATLAVLFAKEAYITGWAFVNGVGLSGL